MCAVYLMRAQRCYEVAALAPEAVHGRVFCDGGCTECDYYREVHGQLPNVLVVTKDSELAADLRAGVEEARFNIEIADCEYNCSAIVNRFKPDFAIVDCHLGSEASRDISYHLVQDPRIPFVRVILAGSEHSLPRDCDKEIFARIDRPFDIRDISDCVSGFKSGGHKHKLGGG